MRFPPSLLDDIRARLPVSQVVARKVALKRAGRELKGLSPFKQEKTPSFFVNDHKGSWFDFSSGQNGDIFKFVMLTEGLSFPEAVERLAEEAGLPMPKASPRDAEQEDERARLYALLEAAARFFEEQLAGGPAAEARRYLDKRGLTPAAIARFRLGYAPNDRSALREHLAKAGFTTAEMAASGMLVAGDDIPVAYDRFRHRIMFPIADLKGRVIAFGGRALDPDAPAKYLNSPETPLFHKGANLYNAHNARGPAHDKGAGDRRRRLHGRHRPVPRPAFRRPSRRSARRSPRTRSSCSGAWRPSRCCASTAMPPAAAPPSARWRPCCRTCKPGYSVQFAFLPDGLDPDDLIRQHGAAAFQDVLDTQDRRPVRRADASARSSRAAGASRRSSAAALEARLKALVARIADRRRARALRARAAADAVGEEPQDHARSGGLRWPARRSLCRQAPRQHAARLAGARSGPRERARLERPARAASTRPRWPCAATSSPSARLPLPAREALLIVTLLNHPWLLEARCEEVAELALTSPPLARLRDALLELLAQGIALDRAEVRSQLTDLGPRQGGCHGRAGDHPQKRQVCASRMPTPRGGSGLAACRCASPGPGWSETCARSGRAGLAGGPERGGLGPDRRDAAAAGAMDSRPEDYR